MTKHPFITVADGRPGECTYRGVRIARNDVERGNSAHWYTVLPLGDRPGSTRERAGTREVLARRIDDYIALRTEQHLDRYHDA